MNSASVLAQRLVGLSGGERTHVLLQVVRGQVAELLGYPGPEDIAADVTFLDLGVDSLIAVELRDRLDGLSGASLPSTMVFDHPTPTLLAEFLDTQLAGESEPVASAEPEPTATGVSDEPIAIVAMACRFPGGVESPEDLWELVSSGAEGHGPFPDDRGWDLEALYDPDPDRQGTSYVREGGFLDHALEFDAAFFGISPREALAMDPQQRLLLETSWEALEQVGIDPASLRGSQTAVYAGVANFDYPLIAKAVPESDMYYTTGTHSSVASGRVAYALGLEGAALTVDTACSSSLVTLHLAAQALRQGECSLALAGGATVLSGPSVYLGFCRQRALSPDGRCRSFAASADGFGPAEGVGMVVLERLSDARRNGHRVLAVVRGSAVNQDGASNGLTAPNGPSQQRVIRQALAAADLSVGDVDVVEAHGTGTALGDPIEAQALLATYGQRDAKAAPLLLGSMKSNIGHTQAAAGVAGVIKSVLALQHGVVPATLHVDAPSPHVDWSAGAVELATESVPWPETGRARRAGISSFGISGTNAHVILEQAPQEQEESQAEVVTPGEAGLAAGGVLWPVSGRSEAALREQAGRLADFLRTGPSGVGSDDAGPEVTDAGIAVALARHRTAFEYRGVVVARDRSEAVAGLEALAGGTESAGVVTDRVVPSGQGVVLVFPGQGSQWVGMGRALLDSSPVFAEWVDRCERVFAPYLDWSLRAVLRGEEGTASLDQGDEVVQPALFTVMTGLAELWRHYGVTPAAVVGHSQGEIAAAYVAGALSLEDAARIVALRSQLLKELAGKGGLASVMLGRAAVEERLADGDGRLSVAVANSPASTVVSGDADAIDQLLERLAAEGIWARRVPIDYASHSAHVEVVEERLRELLADIEPRSASDAVFCSTVTGGVIDTAGLDAGYWYRNLREPVEFQRAVEALLAAGHRVFVEASAHPVLTAAVEQVLEASPYEGAALESLRRDQGELEQFVTALGQAHVRGVGLDWEAVLGTGPAGVALPTYAFQRERFWSTSVAPAAGDVAGLGLAAAGHPLLGAAVESAETGEVLLTGRLSLESHPWLADHAVAGSVLLPGTAFVEMALRAGEEVGCDELAELVLEAPLVLPEQGNIRVQVTVGEPDDTGHRPVSVYSRDESAGPGDPWTRHAGGLVTEAATPGSGDAVSDDVRDADASWPPAGAQPVAVEDFYARTARRGYDYGPVFRGLRAVWRRGEELFAEVRLPQAPTGAPRGGDPAGAFGLHPALLDTALHPMLLNGGLDDDGEGPWLPFSWNAVRLHATGADGLRVRLLPRGTGTVAVELADLTGRPVASARELVTRPVSVEQLRQARDGAGQALFRLAWQPLPEAKAVAATDTYAVIDAGADLGARDVAARAGTAVRAEIYPDLTALRDHAPGVVLAPYSGVAAGVDVPQSAEAVTADVLGLVQQWLADDRWAGSRLAVLTSSAVATEPGADVTGLACAPVWGLVRSAETENPGRFLLVDMDDDPSSWAALPAALTAAIAAEESQIALRGGRALVPRLAPHGQDTPALVPDVPDRPGTLLVTGGTGTLGGLVARHLVRTHRFAHVVLTSRSGRQAPGTAELEAELAALGTKVTIAACDAADRAALTGLLDAIPGDHPLTAVVHAAGILDDGVIPSLTTEQLARVMAPKVQAAWNLHELTRGHDLSLFALFSSVAGILGTAGQANYAAANAFLDGLATHRRAQGLAATSLAWGYWDQATGMTRHLDRDGMLARLRRIGVLPLETEQGLTLFDTATARGTATVEPVLVTTPLDTAALRSGAAAVPLLLRGLVRMPRRRRAAASGPETAASGLVQSLLAADTETEQDRMLRGLVQAEVAAVLGSVSPEGVRPEHRFIDLGFDSLTTVELRNRLSRATGQRLPATLVFDYPTPAELARYLRERLLPETAATAGPGNEEPSRTAEADAIAAMDVDELVRLALDDHNS
ncbi:SDR family NAD(P)-dependent oxidoreductase [Streptomyces benahoarensis]|nr:type I polyketide synthase [Streptomyces benahoarensis]TSB28925.1 SDR family NAD(P)-dependent oxidoreductase [Streptomyces benahoarensis]